MSDHYLKKELYALVRTNEDVFDFLQAGSLDGIWYWDLKDTEHEWMSPRFWEVFGYEPATKRHLATEWQDMIHPDDLGLALENFEKHLQDPMHPYDQVVRYRHADGHWIWVRCRGLIIRDPETGEGVRMLGAHTDVTALKETEVRLETALSEAQQLRLRAEDRFQDLYDSSPDMYVSVHPETSHVLACNATVVRTLGYERDVIVGRSVLELYDPSSLPDAKRAFEEFVQTGQVNNAELTLRRKDGGTIPVLLSVRSVRDSAGNIEHSISTWRDISNLKQVERLSRLTEELKRSNEELEQFAYVVSHDLQEPLRMISSFTELLREAEAGSDDADKYLGFVLEGSQRMQALVRDLLEFSRVGRAAERSQVSVESVLLEVKRDLFEAVTESGASITWSAPLPMVHASQLRIRQLFLNLLGNAIKFGGSNVEIRAEARDGWTEFSVRDDGIGIASDHHRRIFRIFQRLHARDKYPGTGLGLALCRKIVRSLGGRIWLESKPGEGTTFYFTLPSAPN